MKHALNLVDHATEAAHSALLRGRIRALRVALRRWIVRHDDVEMKQVLFDLI